MVQRQNYWLVMGKKRSPMTQERIDLLNNLGFVWNALEMAWNLHLNSFKRFREEYGHSIVPLNHPKYPKLYSWIREQRYKYSLMKQGKKSNMTPARVKVLDSIGFCWDICEARWSLNLQELTEFMDKHGHCVIPVSNPKLRSWVKYQRCLYNAGSMTEERIRALGDIGVRCFARHK
jgi:hypothetical protein